MNSDELLIIKYPYKMSQQRVAAVRENILKQKESGVILLADFCSVLVKPKDIEIQVEFEEEKWIPFSEELPPKDKKVHVSTFGIVTIGERTSEADEPLRLSILDPMNNMYKNVDPHSYQITHWQPLPQAYNV